MTLRFPGFKLKALTIMSLDHSKQHNRTLLRNLLKDAFHFNGYKTVSNLARPEVKNILDVGILTSSLKKLEFDQKFINKAVKLSATLFRKLIEDENKFIGYLEQMIVDKKLTSSMFIPPISKKTVKQLEKLVANMNTR